jgi:hypothetical protein
VVGHDRRHWKLVDQLVDAVGGVDTRALRTLRDEMCRRSPSSITVSYSGESPDDEPTVCFVRVLRDGTG